MFKKLFAVIDDSVYKETSLSGYACEKLGLLARVNAVSTEHRYAKLLEQHANIFSVLGKAKTVYSARLKLNVTPVIKPSRSSTRFYGTLEERIEQHGEYGCY